MKNWQRTYDIRKNWWRLDGELIKTWWRAGEELVKSWWRTDELLLRPFFCVFGPRVGSGTQFWNNHMDPFFYSVEDQFTLWYRSGLVSPWKFFHRCKIEIFDPSWSPTGIKGATDQMLPWMAPNDPRTLPMGILHDYILICIQTNIWR